MTEINYKDMELSILEEKEDNEIERLKQKIKKQEKIIKKQEKRLKNEIRINESYRHMDYTKCKNEFSLEDMIKNLEIFMNYIKNENYEYKIYGNFFERIMSNVLVHGSIINIFVNTIQIEKFEGLCDIYFSLKKIANKEDYNLIKNYVIQDGIIIQYYKLDLIVDGNVVINLIIHNTKELLRLNSTSENICLTEDGIENFYNFGNNNFYSTKAGLDLLMNIYLLKNGKTNIIYNKEDKKLNGSKIIEKISTQLYYENQNIQVMNKFPYLIEDCPVCLEPKKCFILECSHKFCLECINNHMDNRNYENKSCPLCRKEMILK